MKDIQVLLKEVWPEWEIAERIGEGSFGTVYRAVRKNLAGVYQSAIKVTAIPGTETEREALMAEGLDQNQTTAYFQKVVQDCAAEIQLMDAVKGYTNIVAIEDYQIHQDPGESIWYILIRMELLNSLPRKVSLEGITEDEIIQLGIDICTALDVCGRKNIVHRDIKPENIFVNDSGNFKLGDFGIARRLESATEGLSRKGTPNYMSPEMYKAQLPESDLAAVAKVDQYSLGLVMYWLGNQRKLPFVPTEKEIPLPSERRVAFERRIKGEALPLPGQVSPELGEIILKACAYLPENRYENAAQMGRELRKLKMKREEGQNPSPVPVPDPALAPDPNKMVSQSTIDPGETPHSSNSMKRWIVLLLVILLVGGGAFLIHQSNVKKGDSDDSKTTDTPTTALISAPSDIPSENPTNVPIEMPTDVPTEMATDALTETPTDVPTETPTDVPTDVPTETPIEGPTEAPTELLSETVSSNVSWPSKVLTRTKTQLKQMYTENGRRYSNYGPDATEYFEAGGYKPAKVRSAFALLNEGDYVLVELYYQSASTPRMLYFEKNDLTTFAQEEANFASPVSARTVQDVKPYMGPGESYARVEIEEKNISLTEGTEVSVFFETDGWLFSELEYSNGKKSQKLRAWLPADQVVAE